MSNSAAEKTEIRWKKLNKDVRRCDTDIINFLDEHTSDKDDRQDFCPVDGWSVDSGWIEFEEKNIGEK